jgi:hypothetical protein
MSLETENEALIVRYLLGDLAAEEQRQIEQRYFIDDQLFESVCSAEEQLIRDYLRGELPTERGRRFEARYLQSPQLSERVESARLLMQSAEGYRNELLSLAASAPGRRSVSRPSFRDRLREFFRLRAGVFGFATAGLAAAALLVAVWFGMDNRRLRTELAASESRRSSLAARLHAEVATTKGNPAHQGSPLPASDESELGLTGAVRAYAKGVRAVPLAFVLSAGVTRGEAAGRQRLIIPVRGVDRVRLSLDFTPFEQYTSYRVIVSSVDGGEVSSRDLPGKNLIRSGSKLVIDVSAASLPEGDYIVVVKGGLGTSRYEDLESYYFQVVRGLKPR